MFSPGVNLVEAGVLLWIVSQEIDLPSRMFEIAFSLKTIPGLHVCSVFLIR